MYRNTKISSIPKSKIQNVWRPVKKITRYAKKQENTIHNEERKQSNETDTELTQMFELADKDIKMVIGTVFHMFKRYV